MIQHAAAIMVRPLPERLIRRLPNPPAYPALAPIGVRSKATGAIPPGGRQLVSTFQLLNKGCFKAYLLAGASTILIASSASAQTPPESTLPVDQGSTTTFAPAHQTSGLEEIVVTAQRRSEDLSKTPVAVSIISGTALSDAQIVSEQDLQAAVPGLQVRGTLNSEQLNYTLRGQSVDAYSGARPGVLPYLNEVQIGGSGTSTAFYDLQSVQVLKGPQGILFGRSATGGAVLFTTQKPTSTLGGYAQGTVGDYGTSQFEGALNLPIVGDKLLMRVAGFYQHHDGYQYNLYNNQDVGRAEREGLRVSLTANDIAGRGIDNDLVVDYLHSTGQSTEGVISGLNQAAYIPVSSLYAGTSTPAATATGIATLQAFTHLPAAQVASLYTAYFANPKHFAGGLTAFQTAQQARGPYTIDIDGANGFRNNNIIVTDATSYELNDDTKIKNIFGYTYLDSVLSNDTDGTPYTIAQASPPGKSTTRQTSEEIQVLGDTLNNKLRYVAGFYFSSEHFDYRGFADSFDILGPFEAFLNDEYRLRNTTEAGYVHATYKLLDNGLSANAGVRYTSEEVEITNQPADSNHRFCSTAGYSCDQTHTFDKLSWQAGLEDQLDPKLLLYVVSRRAYKSGGFNGFIAPLVGTGTNAGNGFLAEQVTDVELGAKFQDRVAGMPVRLNAAFFYDWEENSQRTAYTFVGVQSRVITANVPHGTTYGLEAESQIKPFDWLAFGATGTYTHAEFSGVTRGFTAIPGCHGATVVSNQVPNCFDGVPDAPEFTGTIYADITIPLTSDLFATLHGDAYHQTSTTTSTQSTNSAGTALPAYTIADFHVGIESKKGGWSITANVKNAFNEVYYIGGIPTGTIYQINTLIPGQPRTYSISTRIKF
jgi:iron complex outermembrane receptor protein